MDNSFVTSFPPQTIDKVERLLDLLEEMVRHPHLRGRFALHGGTAINLFVLNIPRLSVDIDLSYIGTLSREEMLRERPLFERAIEEVAKSQGYSVTGGAGGHAGRSFVLGYSSSWGSDHVKVDSIYLNRSPLVPVVFAHTPLRPELGVPSFCEAELFGGKTKAFFDRVKVRDLYDISNLRAVLARLPEPQREFYHEVILYYASLSATFPHGFEARPDRFLGCGREIEEQLHPMLRKGEDLPSLEALMENSRLFIDEWVLARTDAEREYLDRFGRGEFAPELLFGEGEVAEAALASPEAQWKLQNLRVMARGAKG